MKKISCGILIFNENEELLLCHSTGNNFWDIPKGLHEEKEEYIETAIRETFEETGFIVKAEDLEDLGLFKYSKGKDLYLFKYKGKTQYNSEEAVCTSFFEHFRTQKMTPEVDDFEYFQKEDILIKVCKSMNKLLTSSNILD